MQYVKEVLLSVVAFFIPSVEMNDNVLCVGFTKFNCVDSSRSFEGQSRPINIFVWYPAEQPCQTQKMEYDIWKIQDAAHNAPVTTSQGKLPLIIFSHGYSGHPYTNSWFGEYLAARGYIVASVQHYGNNFPTYGDDSSKMIPEISVRLWNRPQDMTVALDYLLGQSTLKGSIDTNRIGAAGFSQGAIAAMWLGGIQASLTQDIVAQQMSFVKDPFMAPRHFKGISQEYLAKVVDDLNDRDFEHANKSYRDSRIKAVFAMAPGIAEKNTIMFTQGGLAKNAVPACIVIGQDDDVDDAQSLAKYIPNNSMTILPGHVTHWTLLNEGTEEGKKLNAFLTVDDESIDRAAIHQQVGAMALQFFNDKLLK